MSYPVVVKFLRFRLLKRVIVLLLFVFCGGSPAIASTFSMMTQESAHPPDDLQSLVIQTADSLDLPLFPLDASDTDAQAKAQDNDWEEEAYLAPPRINVQTSPAPALGNATASTTKP